MLFEAAAFGQVKRRDDVGRAARRQAEDMVHHIHYLVFLDQLARGGGVGLADAGVEEFQVFVDLGAGAHGGAWVVRVHLLLDGERQGRLARSRQAGDDHQLVLRNLQTDAFQVVDLRVADGDIRSCLLFQGSEKLNLQRYGKAGKQEVGKKKIIRFAYFWRNWLKTFRYFWIKHNKKFRYFWIK